MADLEEKDEILLLDDESTSTAASKEILACLTSLNANMLAVNTSLQQFRSDLHMGEPATNWSISSDKAELSEQEDDQQSDADKLLNQQGSKRRRIADDSTPEGIESVINNDSHNNGKDHTGSQVQEEDPLLAEIAQAMDEGEKTAPNISDQLAKIINSRWLNKLKDESLREKLDAHLRPANCDRLITPKVNPEIWGRLDKETRAKDLMLSYLQSNLTAVGNILSKTTDMLLKARADKNRVDVETMIRMNMDAIAIMGHTTYNLGQRRRNVMRPTLNKDYATLCASHVPVTTFLFGDELQTQLNHIGASNKIKNTASASYTSQKRPYTQSQVPARSGLQKSFLWKPPPQSGKTQYKRKYKHRANQPQDQRPPRPTF